MLKIPQFDIDRSMWIENNRLSGKKLAAEILQKIRMDIAASGMRPGLAAVLAGNDAASNVYVNAKEKDAAENGLYSKVIRLNESVTQEQLLAHIHDLNHDQDIHGILVQLPLPSHLNSREILQAILPEKDADGFHFENIGRLSAGEAGTIACTPLGVMVMLKQCGVPLSGKSCVVLGRSNIVGKPMAALAIAENCTVTVCHSRTIDLEKYIRDADILISATGQRNLFDESIIPDKAIVIDVGMHREGKKLTGDLNFEKFANRVQFVTPVPGGVGPMTRAMLIWNTYNNAVKMKEAERYA
ncbi:MAG: bifunctional 5,10-methylenetetrahydrofolate dehydrogenase/5,10-methenyltetrahydrofolate cyclohydrolase [Leptospiraceae bacterium]|nr:bifunctional 5,10-methylenetetrahydrofolate dehydrogenase/5,10-methenyltetrahydrofolate cyclohydrolase [Leptospiraceae bacterium]